MIVNVCYSKREYGRMKRNGESEISTMTWDRHLPDRVVDAWGVDHMHSLTAFLHSITSEGGSFSFLHWWKTQNHLLPGCLSYCILLIPWLCVNKHRFLPKEPWNTRREATPIDGTSYMRDWTFVTNSEATEFTSAWASVQELEGRKRYKAEIQKLTLLYNELSKKYENLEGSVSEEAIRKIYILYQVWCCNQTEQDTGLSMPVTQSIITELLAGLPSLRGRWPQVSPGSYWGNQTGTNSWAARSDAIWLLDKHATIFATRRTYPSRVQRQIRAVREGF